MGASRRAIEVRRRWPRGNILSPSVRVPHPYPRATQSLTSRVFELTHSLAVYIKVNPRYPYISGGPVNTSRRIGKLCYERPEISAIRQANHFTAPCEHHVLMCMSKILLWRTDALISKVTNSVDAPWPRNRAARIKYASCPHRRVSDQRT